LKLMEDEEIDYSVLSISSPHLSAAPDKEMLELTEEANTFAAEMVTAHQDKLDYFASLPLPLVEESIQMIDRALDDQHALGFTLPTNA
ncbi:amidohydrolase, partial [Staphylococcus hominis]